MHLAISLLWYKHSDYTFVSNFSQSAVSDIFMLENTIGQVVYGKIYKHIK